jgi:predicted DNA binding CopG/RHH family protein
VEKATPIISRVSSTLLREQKRKMNNSGKSYSNYLKSFFHAVKGTEEEE